MRRPCRRCYPGYLGALRPRRWSAMNLAASGGTTNRSLATPTQGPEMIPMPRHLSIAAFLVYSGALAAVAVHGWWTAFTILACIGGVGSSVVYMVSNRARQARHDHDPAA